MKIYKVECQDELHRIGIDSQGEFHLFDHDIEEEETLREMGLDASRCYELLAGLVADPDWVLVDASIDGDLGAVKLALAVGADVSCNSEEPLVQAVANDDVDLVDHLLQSGAKINSDGWVEAAETAREREGVEVLNVMYKHWKHRIIDMIGEEEFNCLYAGSSVKTNFMG